MIRKKCWWVKLHEKFSVTSGSKIQNPKVKLLCCKSFKKILLFACYRFSRNYDKTRRRWNFNQKFLPFDDSCREHFQFEVASNYFHNCFFLRRKKIFFSKINREIWRKIWPASPVTDLRPEAAVTLHLSSISNSCTTKVRCQKLSNPNNLCVKKAARNFLAGFP